VRKRKRKIQKEKKKKCVSDTYTQKSPKLLSKREKREERRLAQILLLLNFATKPRSLLR
jgi:hypothetical protein